MRKILMVLMLVSLPLLAVAQSADRRSYGNMVVDEITSIYDGDTFRATISAWPEVIGYRIGILRHVQCPSLNLTLPLAKTKNRSEY